MSNFKINYLSVERYVLYSAMRKFYEYIENQTKMYGELEGIMNSKTREWLYDVTVIRMTYNTKNNNIIYMKYSCNCNVLIQGKIRYPKDITEYKEHIPVTEAMDNLRDVIFYVRTLDLSDVSEIVLVGDFIYKKTNSIMCSV